MEMVTSLSKGSNKQHTLETLYPKGSKELSTFLSEVYTGLTGIAKPLHDLFLAYFEGEEPVFSRLSLSYGGSESTRHHLALKLVDPDKEVYLEIVNYYSHTCIYLVYYGYDGTKGVLKNPKTGEDLKEVVIPPVKFPLFDKSGRVCLVKGVPVEEPFQVIIDEYGTRIELGEDSSSKVISVLEN